MIPSQVLWSDIKGIKDEMQYCMVYIGTSAPYVIFIGDRFNVFYTVLIPSQTSEVTDFQNNYKTAAKNVASESLAQAQIAKGECHVFTNEALASGVYEDSMVVGCDYSKKTFNIENKHVSGQLAFKIWGSPNNTDYEEIQGETILAASTKVTVVNNDFWKYVKISAKGNGAASTIDAYLQVGP